jgi:hypothetical protein
MPRPLRAVVKIAGRIGASQQWHHQRIPWPRGTLQAGAFDGSVVQQPENVSLWPDSAVSSIRGHGSYLGISCRHCGRRTTAEDDPSRTPTMHRSIEMGCVPDFVALRPG